MFCHNCGKQVPDGVKFCPFCGAQQAAQSQTPAPKKKTGLFAGLAVILIIAVILTLVLVKLFGGSEAAAPAEESVPAAAESAKAAEKTEPAQTEPAETVPPREDTKWYTFESVDTSWDGYTIRHVLNISQWISYTNDYETLQEAWSKVGKDRSLPGKETMGIGSNYINNGQYTSFLEYDEIFYAVGTLEAFNETENYDITESDPYTTYFSIGIGSVHSSLLVMYGNGNELFGVDNGGKSFEKGSGYGVSAKMKSNHWGKVPIVICYLIDKTPNEPEGFPIPRNLLVWFQNKHDCSFNLSGEQEEPETKEPETEAPEPEAETTTEASGQIGTTEASAGAELTGVWKGSYSPSQGKTGCTLDIHEENGVLRGTFEFYNLQGKSNSKEGSFAFVVEDLGGGNYCLKEDKWISRPGNYSMISWYVTLDGDSLQGNSKQNGTGYAIEAARQ